MAIRLQVLCGIALAFGPPFASGQTITVNDPRPMMAFADKLQSMLNVPINYEDPRYENPGDMQDVTDAVVKNRAQFASRVLIPRGGPLTVTLPNSPLGMNAANLLSIFPLVTAAHRASGYPGTFDIANRNGSWYVEPTALRTATGISTTVRSVMATKIRLPFRQQTGSEALQAILSQVSQSIGVKIGIGAVPFAALANPVNLGANDEAASVVLARLFSQLQPPSPDGADVPRWSYRLLFDPGLRYYMFNTTVVTYELPGAGPDPNSSAPATDSKVIRKQQKQQQ